MQNLEHLCKSGFIFMSLLKKFAMKLKKFLPSVLV